MTAHKSKTIESNISENSLTSIVRKGIIWSTIQNWGNRVFSLLLSILLARLLSPEEFGIASAAALALLLTPMIADMGFGESIMQRRNLKPTDLNLPFFLSSAIAIFFVSSIIIFRAPIADWLGIGDRTIYLVATVATILVSVPTGIQEAIYKRNMQFRNLAVRAFAANICGGIAAFGVALAGFGIWAFVIQSWVALIVNSIWIWSQPKWLPTTYCNWSSLRQMLRFGAPVVGQRLVDFFGTRTIDFVIINQIGLVGYGLYAVGSRLYQVAMQLMMAAFYDVSLTVLSTIAHDRSRIAAIYLKTISTSARLLSPVFVLLAALAPEICTLLFGQKWAGVDEILQLLSLMGAVHCVQYMNGSFLSARGRPELILVTGIVKSILQIGAILIIDSSNITGMTTVYVCAALIAAPLSFTMVAREIGLVFSDIFSHLARPMLVLATTFSSVGLLRPYISGFGNGSLIDTILLVTISIACHFVGMVIIDRSSIKMLAAEIKRYRNVQ